MTISPTARAAEAPLTSPTSWEPLSERHVQAAHVGNAHRGHFLDRRQL